ncbi:HAD-like superfamily [Sesbania bispinosa]|nr:HAD-like superfamily [Sesbania bispinosa]
MAHKDIFRITGLPIDWKPVCLDDEKLRVGEFHDLTGIDCAETKISLQTLVDEINNSYEAIINMDDFRLNQICRIVALLAIGCLVFALVRIPFLIPYVYKERDPESLHNLSFSMMIEFTNIIGRDEIWTYEELSPTNGNNYYHQELLGYSVTTPVAPSLAVKHQPHLAPRQFPSYNPHNRLIHQWLEDLPPENLGRKKKKGNEHDTQSHEPSSSLPSLPGDVDRSQNRKRTNDMEDLPTSTSSLQQIQWDHKGRGRQCCLRGTRHQRLKKKLLVLDINGLSAHIVCGEPEDRLRQPDAFCGKNAIFMRPFYNEFLEFCFENFEVGIWSSRTKRNLHQIIDKMMGTRKNKLLFCWDRSRCTLTNVKSPDSSRSNKIVFKELKKHWDNVHSDLPWEKGYYNESNTLLLDDSPYKGLCNPPHTSVFPQTFTYTDDRDNSLGEGGELRAYLHGLAKAADMQRYVAENPFGQPRISQTSQHGHCSKIALNSISGSDR